MKGVASGDRDREHYQRQDADLMGRQQMIEWKSETGHTCRHRACQKKPQSSHPAVGGEQSKQDDKSRANPYQLMNTWIRV